MPRPCKRKLICSLPGCRCFGPKGSTSGAEQTVFLTLDEYESIRLIDFEDLTQEQCAEKMAVARTTAQAVYSSARKKLAECLVKGKELHIEGGNYVLCEGYSESCSCSFCRHRCKKKRGLKK